LDLITGHCVVADFSHIVSVGISRVAVLLTRLADWLLLLIFFYY